MQSFLCSPNPKRPTGGEQRALGGAERLCGRCVKQARVPRSASTYLKPDAPPVVTGYLAHLTGAQRTAAAMAFGLCV